VRNFLKIGLIVFALAIFLIPFGASAALDLPYWGPLAVDCAGGICKSLCQLLLLAENLINFGLTILLFAIAPILLTWGGFVILTAGGSSERLGSGRKILFGTVIGVAIALGAYLIIGTFLWGLGIIAGEGEGKINWPNVSCSAGTPPVVTTPQNPDVVPGGGGTGDGDVLPPVGSGNTDENIRQALMAVGISIVSSGNCNDINDPTCTSLQGLPWSVVDGLIAMKNACIGCNLIVTGGTEVGHQTHGPGKARVDIDNTPTVNQYVYSKIGTDFPIANTWYTGDDGINYYWEVDHWHLCFEHRASCYQ
jgi:hypothetical protein